MIFILSDEDLRLFRAVVVVEQCHASGLDKLTLFIAFTVADAADEFQMGALAVGCDQ